MKRKYLVAWQQDLIDEIDSGLTYYHTVDEANIYKIYEGNAREVMRKFLKDEYAKIKENNFFVEENMYTAFLEEFSMDNLIDILEEEKEIKNFICCEKLKIVTDMLNDIYIQFLLTKGKCKININEEEYSYSIPSEFNQEALGLLMESFSVKDFRRLFCHEEDLEKLYIHQLEADVAFFNVQ